MMIPSKCFSENLSHIRYLTKAKTQRDCPFSHLSHFSLDASESSSLKNNFCQKVSTNVIDRLIKDVVKKNRACDVSATYLVPFRLAISVCYFETFCSYSLYFSRQTKSVQKKRSTFKLWMDS